MYNYLTNGQIMYILNIRKESTKVVDERVDIRDNRYISSNYPPSPSQIPPFLVQNLHKWAKIVLRKVQ